MDFKRVVDQAVQIMWKATPEAIIADGGQHMMYKLLQVQEDNNGFAVASNCNSMSTLVVDFLPTILANEGYQVRVDKITSENKAHHYYNAITNLDGDEEEILCDLSIAQFFSKPLDLFKGNPYFIGYRNELKNIVLPTQEKTLRLMQQNFPELQVSGFAAFDEQIEKNPICKAFMREAEMTGKEPIFMRTYLEKMSNTWDANWGDKGHLVCSNYATNLNS